MFIFCKFYFKIMSILLFALKFIGVGCYYLSCLFPRDRKKWLFGHWAGYGYSGNAKFLLIDILENDKNIRPIWISHKRKEIQNIKRLGIEVYYWLSVKGIYHCLTSKVFIYNSTLKSINTYLSGNAYAVNLWHGVGIKSCKWTLPNTFSNRITYFAHYRKPDLFLSTSPFSTKYLVSGMYDIDEKQIIEGEYPRNAILSQSKENIKRFIHKYEGEVSASIVKRLEKYHKVYIYMPTWRDDNRDIIEGASFDLDYLNNVLNERNELFLFRLHSGTKIEGIVNPEYSNIYFIPREVDIYPILPFTDMLITDYSSIYYDYILMDKEILLFPFDLNEYLSSCRNLLLDYDHYTPGCRVSSFNELMEVIGKGEQCYVKERDWVIQTFWDGKKEHIIEYIKKEISNSYKNCHG